MGVDGLRLDAVPYLYEREGTNCENLPETYAFLKKLRSYVDGRYENRMLLAEANQWPEDAVAYFGDGDGCHMAFHFPLMPRLFMALRMEDRIPVIDILEQTPSIPEPCQWALFLRNHDELTLEMVTDEERDYMYRVYAQDPQMQINLGIRRRLSPLLGNQRRRIELMNSLLFSLPGTPVLYYGDEIGMGDNVYLGDRNGVRTPMQWSADRNAGFSKANSQRLYLPIIIDPEYHYEAVNVDVQQNNPSSLLWWMKRLIVLRHGYRSFGRGTLEFLYPENRKVLTFIRRYQDERILVIANLSRFVQCAELDLSAFKGMIPVELFGHTEFPPIGDLPYFITLAPHTFFWFSIEPPRPVEVSGKIETLISQLPTLHTQRTWEEILRGKAKAELETVLPEYLRGCRWFGGKARAIRSTKILEAISVPSRSIPAFIIFVQTAYVDGDPETYILPVASAGGDRGERILRENPHSAIARIQLEEDKEDRVLYDATEESDFSKALLETIANHRSLKGRQGQLVGRPTKAFRPLANRSDAPLESSILKAEQSNTSIVFKDRFILKLFRRLDRGINPDLEVGRFLTEKGFPHIPAVAGALEYAEGRNTSMTVGVLHGLVSNQGDAWEYTLDVLANYFEQAMARGSELKDVSVPGKPFVELVGQDLDPLAREAIGAYLESARLLGQRTGELHLALSSDLENPEFAPEPFSKLYQRSVYQSMRNLSSQVFQLLRRGLDTVPEAIRGELKQLLGHEPEILRRFRSILDRKISAMRIRCHGDYHLGQVLYTGKDFVIIDFEGEPAHPLSERRLKRSPLRDVAGMLRSFHYAAYAALFVQKSSGLVRPEVVTHLDSWARFWHCWVCVTFLKAYLEVVAQAPILPQEEDELRALLDIYLLEKAIYELGYEINSRPDWVRIPLQGIEQLIGMD